jgi:predicted alpha/beta hydrolase family esterase
MERDVLIFHGTAGSPEGNWFPWLKGKLEEKGCRVVVPRFPTPEGESLTSWLEVLQAYKDRIGTETILVGHSKGGLFTLRVLEKLQKPAHATFLVSAPIGIKPILYYKEDAAFSPGFDFDWDAIRKNSKHFTVYHSDTDPYVCLDNGRELAKKLGVELQFIPNAGHLNAESGYTKFDKLLEDIEKVL